MKHFFLFVSAAFSFFNVNATTPTWAKDIAPILYSKCTSCHHPGGGGHSSLINYSDAFNVAGDIQYDANSGSMPPWPPDRTYKHFAAERYLTPHQKALINDWVNGGAPSGDTTQAPTKPFYNNLSAIQNPEVSGQIPTYTVSSNSDIYQCFVIPSGLSVDKFITGVEIVPGNPDIVHHVLIYQDTTGVARQKDQATPSEPGYTNFGGIGVANPILIGAWVPGQQPYFYPSGMGVKLYKNSDIVLQVHYPKNSLNKVDSTKFNFRLSTGSLRTVIIQPLLNHLNSGPGSLVNGPLVIPANTTKTFVSKFVNPYPVDFSLLSIAPHMHLIGKAMKCFAVGPTNDTIPLINIKDWNFAWQGQYSFQNILRMPQTYKMYAVGFYDNTSANSRNPNKNSPIQVSLGESTTDEMMLVYFNFLLYQTGDENIVVDSTDYAKIDTTVETTGIVYDDIVSTPQLYELFPNPTNGKTTVRFYLPNNTAVGFKVYDINGRLVFEEKEKNYSNGFNDLQFDTKNYAKGEYAIQLQSGSTLRKQTFIVN